MPGADGYITYSTKLDNSNLEKDLSSTTKKIESLEKTVRDELIKEEFDGSNYKELALKYGLTETWIRNIVLDKAKEIKARPIDGQMNLTDFLE